MQGYAVDLDAADSFTLRISYARAMRNDSTPGPRGGAGGRASVRAGQRDPSHAPGPRARAKPAGAYPRDRHPQVVFACTTKRICRQIGVASS